MQKLGLIIAVVLLVSLLGAYFYFGGREYQFRFSEDELRGKLSKRLPIEKTYLFIFQVVLDRPRVTLVEGSDRVQAGLDLTLNIHINEEPLPLGGSVDASGGVRYDPLEGAFYLTDPVVERLAVQGIPARYTDRVNSVLTKAIAEYYKDRPIYTLKESDVKQAAAKLVLKSVVVQNRLLVVTLGV